MAPRKLPKDALLTEILQKVSSAKTKIKELPTRENGSESITSILYPSYILIAPLTRRRTRNYLQTHG